MERLTWMLAGMLRTAARLLPPGRREWAEAVRAEADQVPAGWPRLGWLAGGLWLAVREAEMMRKVVYWLGVGMVAATAAWAVRLSWHASSAAHPLVVTDRVRVLVGVAALAGLPWVGRRRGWFGPVGTSITARLVRVAGCAALCGLGMAVVRMDRDIGGGPHGAAPFSLSREIAAVVLLGAALAALPVVRTRWPQLDASTLWAFSRDDRHDSARTRAGPGARDRLRGRDPRRYIAAVAGSERVPRRWRHDRPGRGPGRGPGRLRAEYPGRSLRRPDTPQRVRHDDPVRHPGRRGGVLAAVRHRGSGGAARGADPAGTARGLGHRSRLPVWCSRTSSRWPFS